jgi:hypothetical protein
LTLRVGIDSNQKSFQQTVADKVTKRDLVINFRKPISGENKSKIHSHGTEDKRSFREKVQAVIRNFLAANPGASKDRIYDETISRLMHKGQMETHDFEELLREVANEVKEPVKKNLFKSQPPDLFGSHEVGRWYLKETEAGAEEAERASSDFAGMRIQEFLAYTTAGKLKETEHRLNKIEAEIAKKREKLYDVDRGKSDEPRARLVREIRELTEELEKLNGQRAEWERKALDYSQIFEFYVAAVNPKPQASLAEILEDYCYQTDEGNWRPPLSAQEKDEKSGERNRAVRRKIQRLCKMLEGGEAIPEIQRPNSGILVEWIRHCRRTGLHIQGKLLYERGGVDLNELDEQSQADVEEDCQVCIKHLLQ